ncbi:DCC1-like thiol-disulfide oxidoreductase family protein [Prochlorococcus marinus]|uniref:Uncharacterized protein n=1 Tax=Prochlorococcus marinus (strain SARG / CCMP1375 / SS120) TaxID=167539 RepID=Q7VCP5_PROMA|nr:DCC1-like thiol-disulfide oxidoreductase family protein [Prochlorococcus marinus]AAP99739.1 Predicted protein [Prochlorococcus marinus subsp. marinus str. CCMP1375]KGG14446.1 hypothetical protein EV04_0023 [Prochlorococcus marinus str. LG]KGG22564.1 hypothetical protein EV08_0079 [Prochlorococcus marinus str. SS2]KGG24407.1 hypothetical protein EV09_0314 [Prochlorococcus marinus str. SS35]KGG34179.1 hypothetical protein EV10_0025 [Prochlorococcus marinus str. SS51]
MDSKLVFIYDGECPFCKHFAELLELKSGLPDISILNARENLPEITSLLNRGYDIDNGAILLKDEEVLHGANAINWICSRIDKPSDSLLKILSIVFFSKKRTNFIFPLLIIARRFALLLKGVSRKLIC